MGVVKVLLFFLISSLFACDFSNVTVEESNNPVGLWQAVGYFYNDDFVPALDTSFVISYEFFDNGENIMMWERKNTSHLCRRKGKWEVTEKNWISDEVVWLDPKNSMDCGSDTDMQIGKKTFTEFVRCENYLFTKYPFVNEYLIYAWEKR